ncbi:hypothetical protein OC498_03385 [Acinetobacter bohemicus]|uniref:hypothetical protein n=1 Tax=Acinetobacter TaxID=469 RepID=UPI00209AB1CC|nr:MULTISPECIES: hypothetical protein [Acinetobacter]MCO8041841.1 hypothetical protein [Acinetobacter sp. S4400-12]MCU7223952.1 hypothetical protein [Acinetobacter bohemicus]
MRTEQVSFLLQQLQLLYPAAFKRNYLFYSQLKTHGILLEDRKAIISWILAGMIFIPVCLLLRDFLQLSFPKLSAFQTQSTAILIILLFLMLVVPFILKQVKHSSYSLYHVLRYAPLKLTVVIILEGLNLLVLENEWVMWGLFFFGLSVGFVRIYKENLFRSSTQNHEYYQLQQLRRACFWAYRQTVALRLQLIFSAKDHPQYKQRKQQLECYAELYTRLLKSEYEYCKTLKYLDIETYLNERH